MLSRRKLALTFFMAILCLPIGGWGAGAPIQFSVTFSTPMSYGLSQLKPGRYLVTVEERQGQCRLEFADIKGNDKKNSESTSIYGYCGSENGRFLEEPIVKLVAIDKVTLIYFESPYEKFGRTFYVIARLSVSGQ